MNHQVNILAHALEDDQDFVELITELFDMNGMKEYKFFTHPEEFILAFHEKIHLCIVDYYLPGTMTGLDVMKVVLSMNKNCKAIMLSAVQDYRVVIKSLNEGCFKWVDKNDEDHRAELVNAIQQSIGYIKDKIEERELLESLKAEIRKSAHERHADI